MDSIASRKQRFCAAAWGRAQSRRSALLSFIVFFFVLNAGGQKISLNVRKGSLVDLFKQVEAQSPYRFVYTKEELTSALPVTIQLRDASIDEVLQAGFRHQPLTYQLEDHVVVIRALQHDPASTPTKEASAPLMGIVRNENGEPLLGATVQVKGKTLAVSTDEEGRFAFPELPELAILMVSSVGYYPKEEPRVGRLEIDCILRRKINTLDETIVIAYGTTTQRMSTGSVGRITSEEISRQPVSNPLATLAGRVPGVYITQSSGVPGAAFKVEIRGQSILDPTLSRNDPLIIVDGVPYSPGNSVISQVSSAASYNDYFRGQQGGLSPLNSINPSDIESIEVLKDADATAIYGSRGAGGVLLITTKRGRAGDTKVQLSTCTGWSTTTRQTPLLNTAAYLQMREEAFANDGTTPTPANAPDLILWDRNRYTDLNELLIGGTARTHDAQVSLSGGTKQLSFLLGGGFHRETTVFPGDLSDKRISFHFNLQHESVNKRFKAQLTTNYSTDKNHLTGTDLTNYTTLPPNVKLVDSTGRLAWSEGGVYLSTINNFSNPLAELQKKYTATNELLISNLQLHYQLLKHLSLKTSLGFNKLSTDEVLIQPKSAMDPLQNSQPFSNFANGNSKSWILEPQIEYKEKIGKGMVTLLTGATLQTHLNNSSYLLATNFANDLLLHSIAAAGNLTARNSEAEYRYMAIFGRAGYTLKDRYLFNLSARRDGSSRFGPQKQFSDFGALGLGWIFSKEQWVANTLHWLSYGKLRGSYGTTGNDQIGNYQFFDRWSLTATRYGGSAGLQPVTLYNPDFSWELTRKLEVALEIGLINDKLLLTIAGYRNRSSNQLVNYMLPVQTGFSSVANNLPALVENKGIEVSIVSKNIQSNLVSWTTSLQFTLPRNQLLSFPGLSSTAYAPQYKEGASLNALRGYRYTGVDPATGSYTFQDVNGDGVINFQQDYTVQNRSTDPRYYGGLQNNLRFRNWHLDLFVEFRNQLGLTSLAIQATQVPGMIYNQPKEVLDRWQKPGDAAGTQKYTALLSSTAFAASLQLRNSDAIYGDASFARLKNLALTYQLSNTQAGKMHLKSGRLFIQCQNLLTLTNYKGADPETQNFNTLPPLRTLTCGIQITL